MTINLSKPLFRMTLVAALATSAAASALAGGWEKGAPSLKGSYAERVAHVPEPAPIPEYAPEYYIGVSATYAFAARGTITSTGTPLETIDEDSLDGIWSGGVQVGRYFSPNLRGEISLDFRNYQDVMPGRQEYQVSQRVTTGVGTYDDHQINVTHRETANIGYYTGLAKLFYDFDSMRGFRPYVGGGLGFVLYSFKRADRESAACQHSVDQAGTPYVDINGDPTCSGTEVVPGDRDDSKVEVSWGYAAAFNTGVAIDITDSTKFDIGYQATYTSGNVSRTLPSIMGGSSTIKVEDRLDHELRVGLRWDID